MITQQRRLRLAVIAGHGGGDFIALLEARSAGLIDFHVSAFVSTSANTSALQHYAAVADQPAIILPEFAAKKNEHFETISRILQAADPDLILLSGFTFLLPSLLVRSFEGKIINSHHSLLPAHPGLYRKEKLLQSTDKFLGATLHLVDEGVDTGKILSQCVFPNPGMQGLESALRQYRFAQDCMIVQLISDWSGVQKEERIAFQSGIYFQPTIGKKVLELFSHKLDRA